MNLAAVHYHFGSKDKLLSEVVERRIAPVNRERLAGLEAARAVSAPEPVSVEVILECFLAPVFALARRREFEPVSVILATEPLETAGPLLRATFGEVNAAFVAALGAALPELSADEIGQRFQLVVGGMLQMISRRGDVPAPERPRAGGPARPDRALRGRGLPGAAGTGRRPMSAKVVAPIAVLVGCGLLAWACVATRTGPELQGPEVQPRLVRVLPVEPRDVRLEVLTHGTVVPRTESDLVAEVAGPAVEVSPSLVSGGYFAKGDELVRIDPRDYEVAVQQERANLARSRSEHDRARKELVRIRGLRERSVASDAQLDDASNAERVARASLDEARARLVRAERDLERTRIVAPFDGRVRDEQIDVGQFVARGQSVGRIYAIDWAEVRLPVRDDEIGFLDLPLWHRGEVNGVPEPEVVLRARFAGAEHEWRGRVVRTEGEIDPDSRMVHVVARVEDPYGRSAGDDRPPLAVGLFVSAAIQGRELSDVFVVPRSAMRGPDQLLVVDEEDRLRFRPVEVLRADRETAVISTGLKSGDRVCTSPIETPVDGMRVRVAVPAGSAEPVAGEPS